MGEIDARPWDMWLVQTDRSGIGGYVINAQELLDLEAMQALEAARLATVAALRFMNKLSTRPKLKKPKKDEGRDSDTESDDEDEEEDGLGPDEDGVRKVERVGQNQRVPWGNGLWSLSWNYSKKVLVGVGANCNQHHNPGDKRRCKKDVTFGLSGLDEAAPVATA